jgi:hypothetical protein
VTNIDRFHCFCHDTAQAVSRPFTVEHRIRARVSQCGTCGGQSGNGTGFFLSPSVFSCQYHSTTALHDHISPKIGDHSSET